MEAIVNIINQQNTNINQLYDYISELTELINLNSTRNDEVINELIIKNNEIYKQLETKFDNLEDEIIKNNDKIIDQIKSLKLLNNTDNDNTKKYVNDLINKIKQDTNKNISKNIRALKLNLRNRDISIGDGINII